MSLNFSIEAQKTSAAKDLEVTRFEYLTRPFLTLGAWRKFIGGFRLGLVLSILGSAMIRMSLSLSSIKEIFDHGSGIVKGPGILVIFFVEFERTSTYWCHWLAYLQPMYIDWLQFYGVWWQIGAYVIFLWHKI